MTYYLGVDIGTFETKGVIVDGAGQIVASAAKAHKMHVPQPGWAEHHPDDIWWSDFVHVTRTMLSDSGISARDVRAVAASAIGPCMLPVDADGRPLMNGVLYGVDTRAHEEINELNARIGAEVILDRCGNALTSQSVGPKMLWLKNKRPELYGRTAKFLTSTSYVNFRLTGRYAIDHYSAANSSPLYDVSRQDWTFDLADDIARADQLPDLLWSTDIAGQVTAQAASQTGLAEGTPVTCGTIDAAAEALSVGVLDVGDMMVMYGSTIFMIMLTAERIRDPRLWYAPWLFSGEHASMAGLATSGTLTHWFRDELAQDLATDNAFSALAAEAAQSPPGANGLIMLPYFSGERTPIHDPNARGCLFGLNLTHKRGDIYRAMIEGIALGTNHVFEAYREIDSAPQRVIAVGGGTRNELWLKATSDITGQDQIVCENSIGASYGDALLAAVAVGDVKRDDIRQWNPAARQVKAGADPVYARRYEQFRKLYEQTKDIAGALAKEQ